MLQEHDRVNFVPPHDGPTVFPNFPLFLTLIRFAARDVARIAIRDDIAGFEKTYLQLLTDALALRNTLRELFPKHAANHLNGTEEIYICILAPGSYEYVVAFLAVIAFGAAAVPLSPAYSVEEASYFIHKSSAVAVLSGSRATKFAEKLTAHLDLPTFKNVPISSSLQQKHLDPDKIFISSDRILDPNGAGTVIFTSGTTGPPKGGVLRRSYTYDTAQGVADLYQISSGDTILHVLPVHHATGIGINLLPFLIVGACIEFRSGSFDPEWTWNRWKNGGITFFSGVPTIYMRMMRYYQQVLTKLPKSEMDLYISGARRLRTCICGTSALPQPVQDFWTGIRGGESILTRYGSTEMQAIFTTRPDSPKDLPSGTVGFLTPGVEVKLSDGNEGEILTKSPYMFSKYLNDPKATAEAHDQQGYFKTGDIARKEGPYYFILGRASLDIIKSGGYKISALDIEREILGLPYVSEVAR